MDRSGLFLQSSGPERASGCVPPDARTVPLGPAPSSPCIPEIAITDVCLCWPRFSARTYDAQPNAGAVRRELSQARSRSHNPWCRLTCRRKPKTATRPLGYNLFPDCAPAFYRGPCNERVGVLFDGEPRNPLAGRYPRAPIKPGQPLLPVIPPIHIAPCRREISVLEMSPGIRTAVVTMRRMKANEMLDNSNPGPVYGPLSHLQPYSRCRCGVYSACRPTRSGIGSSRNLR
jgi:hypothetical protein